MQITIHLPDKIVNTIQEKWNNVPGKVVEYLAIEAVSDTSPLCYG